MLAFGAWRVYLCQWLCDRQEFSVMVQTRAAALLKSEFDEKSD
jgi:hypothetical protein